MGATAEVATDTRDADYPAALEAIERALELSPGLEEALFNRALALEQLQLWRAARKAWEAYLEVDADSPWAREARWRMAAIAIPTRPDPVRIRSEIVTAAAAGGIGDRLAELVTAHRQLTRRGVEEELLPGWGEAWLSGDLKEADRQVRVARVIAEEWETQTGDRTLRDAVAEIDTATGPALKALASGYRGYGQANRAFDAFDLEASQAAAARAIAVLPRRSPAYTWAALVRLACIAYRNGEIGDEARELTASAAADPSSVGRAHWIVGLWLTKRGDPAAGLVEYRQARDAYERLDERDSIVWLQFLIGDAYARLGLSPAAWKYHRLAIAGAPALADGRLESMLIATATLAVVEGRNRVAVHLLDEALTQPDSRKPDQIAEAYLWRSQALRELGRVVEARGDFEHAAVWLARANPLERKYLTGELNLVAGLVEVDSRRAVARLSRSLAAFSESGPAWRLPGVLLARARALLRTGDDAAADADLWQGLVLLRKSIGGNNQEVAWTPRPADREQLFDELVSLALRRGEPERALAIAEMSRENIWRTRPSRIPRRLEALGAVQIRDLLEAGTTVLYYEWLPNRVVLWRLRADGSRFVELPSKPAELAQLISTLATDLSAGAWTSATRTAAMRLYAALLRPATLNGGRLVIVPDGELHRLPFAALIDPETRRFLLEEHELMIAPSASDFIDGHARWQGQTTPPGDALVVGDPLVDQVLLPGMRPLEGARREARMIATFYPHPELLLGGAATRSAFLAALGGKSVVHFAGHSIANDTNPGRSSLALADQGNGADGLLTASEIARLDLTDTQAVVLSGCDTGVSEDGEGSLSVARAFLTAGAPDVVASLWPIADLPSIPLMTAFHRRLRAGERPAAALRGAQLELLRGPEPSLQSPSVWAAFEVFGG